MTIDIDAITVQELIDKLNQLVDDGKKNCKVFYMGTETMQPLEIVEVRGDSDGDDYVYIW